MISYQQLYELRQLYAARALGSSYVDEISIERPLIEAKHSFTYAPDSIEALHAQMEQCHLCDLCKSRSVVQTGYGSGASGVMIVSDFPTQAEDAQGAFAAKVGTTLQNMIEKVLEIPVSDIYYTHLIKCLPPSGQEPSREEQHSCLPYIETQMTLMKPKIVIALGAMAYTGLTRTQERFDKIHGMITPFRGSHIVGIQHPKAVVRNPTLKSEVFNDLKTIKSFLCEQ